jgi:hypothetical protein
MLLTMVFMSICGFFAGFLGKYPGEIIVVFSIAFACVAPIGAIIHGHLKRRHKNKKTKRANKK